MKKILLLTTIYPSPDLNLLNNTSVCHYFAREWVKMGYEVKVIFNYPIYAKFLHWISKLYEKRIASIGCAYVTTKRISTDCRYVLDEVKVHRMPIYKLVPRIKVSRYNIQNQITNIIDSNEFDKFKPDIITAHFFYPHIEIVNELKKKYNANSCIVVHKQTLKIREFCKYNYLELLNNVDTWGFRSISIQKEFEEKYGKRKKHFLCYSGIPSEYITNLEKEFITPLYSFSYVGALIKRKNPSSVIKALNNVYPDKNFSLSVIGEGVEEKKLKIIINRNDCENNVIFFGHLERKSVQNILQKTHCFIMISKDETFGLVYLEAMANGCITIASRNEGMDGIIINGENGFLCEAGNVDELSKILNFINTLSVNQITDISKKAVETAKSLTDNNAALQYLKNISSK